MNFALSEENQFLRDVARDFVTKEVDLAPLLIPGATVADANYERNWKKLVDVGWPGLTIPEAYGGSGMSCLDLAMVAGELGRGLVPSPFFGHLAAAWTILKAGSEAQRAALLPRLADGAATGALAIANADGTCDGPASDAVAQAGGSGYVLSGSKSFVVDAAAADTLVVAAEFEGARRYFVVDARQAGVRIAVLAWRDITRQVCDVVFDGAEAELLDGEAGDVWPWVRDRLLLVLSAENAAGIEYTLAATVAYAKERVTFGRPIGAYQAIKHGLADTFGSREGANAAVLYAAWALSEEAPSATQAVAMALAYSSDAYIAATHQSIQYFGAIGFSWEMNNHLYFKRARANAALLGAPSTHRARVMELLGASAA
jgi:alkylation response protein AidB-like acyl-CoA dehydrogenase